MSKSLWREVCLATGRGETTIAAAIVLARPLGQVSSQRVGTRWLTVRSLETSGSIRCATDRLPTASPVCGQPPVTLYPGVVVETGFVLLPSPTTGAALAAATLPSASARVVTVAKRILRILESSV